MSTKWEIVQRNNGNSFVVLKNDKEYEYFDDLKPAFMYVNKHAVGKDVLVINMTYVF